MTTATAIARVSKAQNVNHAADAALIAAAPDLLVALREIVKEIGPQFGLNDDPGTLNAVSRLARAAIAKATGEQQ